MQTKPARTALVAIIFSAILSAIALVTTIIDECQTRDKLQSLEAEARQLESKFQTLETKIRKQEDQ
jgi:outer membrane murein-binding lipoprotein Lpp